MAQFSLKIQAWEPPPEQANPDTFIQIATVKAGKHGHDNGYYVQLNNVDELRDVIHRLEVAGAAAFGSASREAH